MENMSPISERRDHARYDMYLPIHFNIKDSEDDDSPEGMKYFQGFTKNFSKGGLLIEALNLSQPQMRSIENLEAYISGSILIPTYPRPIRFQARPAWLKHESNNIELIGMYFTDIRKEDIDALLSFAMMINKKTRFVSFISTVVVNAIIAFLIMAIYIHFISKNIIDRQNETINRLQQNQKVLRENIKKIFQKE